MASSAAHAEEERGRLEGGKGRTVKAEERSATERPSSRRAGRVPELARLRLERQYATEGGAQWAPGALQVKIAAVREDGKPRYAEPKSQAELDTLIELRDQYKAMSDTVFAWRDRIKRATSVYTSSEELDEYDSQVAAISRAIGRLDKGSLEAARNRNLTAEIGRLPGKNLGKKLGYAVALRDALEAKQAKVGLRFSPPEQLQLARVNVLIDELGRRLGKP